MIAHITAGIDTLLQIITRPHRHRALGGLIKGRRVLILGSGPSVRELTSIPEDVLVFSCNFGPQALLEKGLRPHVDLYLCTRQILTDASYLKRIEALLEKISIDVFVFKKPSFIRTRTSITSYRRLSRNDAADTYFLRRLLTKETAATISELTKVSNGVRMLQYALFYGASEIYLAGIDLHGRGYGIENTDDNSVYERAHQDADHIFLEAVAKKHKHIYSASVTSPTTSMVRGKILT